MNEPNSETPNPDAYDRWGSTLWKWLIFGVIVYFTWPIWVALYRMLALTVIMLWAIGGGFN